jgi:hypothetical protein
MLSVQLANAPPSCQPRHISSWAFIDLLVTLCEVAEDTSEGMFSKAPIVANAFRELNVALCLWNASVEWADTGVFASAAGSCLMQGLLVPCVDFADAGG